ncbi:MAG TPA: primosomal protein N', partial [bacterium]|nr:primosomal protein N' [bacterium]
PRDLIGLCLWISRTYLCPLNTVLDSAFPFHRKMSSKGIDRSAFHDLQKRTILEKNVFIRPEAVKSAVENNFEQFRRSPAQRRALRILLDEGGSLSAKTLAELASTTLQTLKELEKSGMVSIEYMPRNMSPFGDNGQAEDHFTLNASQEAAHRRICAALNPSKHEIFLLHGVTGSGKTEIYMHAVRCCMDMGKKVIILVPEIALATQIIARFLRRFTGRIAVWHSSLSMTERLYEWNRITSGNADIVIGARSAVFAPLENIGLIIVDEEHEAAYKQESNPRYHARDAAVHRAKLIGCPVVLGSATPSLESIHASRTGAMNYLFLPTRIGAGNMPDIKIIDMRFTQTTRTTSLFCPELVEAIAANLAAGEQSMIFLNHRGYAQYVQCHKCGASLICPLCSVAMKYHKDEKKMKCHVCGFECDVPPQCPSCSSRALRYFGYGTERVANQLRRYFKDAVIERMDRDTTTRKGDYHRIISSFEEHEIDILVGTQMIAKGLDFPGVTLVGVVSADSIMNMPEFRSAERTYQLLTQVAGRAGRRDIPGHVIIQTYNPEHPSILAAADHNSDEFYDYELSLRKESLYPPFTVFVNFIISSEQEDEAAKLAGELAAKLQSIIEQRSDATYFGILGPAEAPYFKLHGKYRYFLLVRSSSLKELLPVCHEAHESFRPDERRGIAVDVQPINML